VTRVITSLPWSSQMERTLLIVATASIALAVRLAGGSNKVTSPVPAGTATVGQADRTAVMPAPPRETSISPVRAQPAASRRTSAAANERWRVTRGGFTGVSRQSAHATTGPRERPRSPPQHRNRLSPEQALA
jgi:hypothetical protein